MEATLKMNIEKLRKDVREYGRTLDEQGIKRAAVDLSQRAENAVKRDFTNYFRQTPSHGGAGKRVRTGRLRSSVKALVIDNSKFGITTNVVYARIHELGGTIRHPGHRRKRKALGIFGMRSRPYTIKMPARHWISEPMVKELQDYLDKHKERLERG